VSDAAVPTGPVLPHDHGGPDWWDPLSVRPDRATSETGPVLGVIAILVGSNIVANEVLPSWAYVPWNLGVAGALVWTAKRYGRCTDEELGLSRRHLLDGLRWGGAAAGAVLAVYAVGAALPATRDLFRDDRAAGVSLAELLWRVGIEIPIGTVLAEELMFRGVLPAMFRRRFAARRNWAVRADVASALLFGLWHVLPAIDLGGANPAFKDLPGGVGTAAAIVGSVAGTAAAGLFFSWLRNRSGSVLAPMVLHSTINGGGFLIAWIVQH
jgi:membrane protease YdiL (CAAX protease family)